MNADERPPKGSWAPGGYYNKCRTCNRKFIGDKRATSCADCAYSETPTPLPNTPDIIVTQSDYALYLGSGELKKCPFCGAFAMSYGKKTPNGLAVCWTIRCEQGLGCGASVWATDPDQAKARQAAVEQWNRRVG